MKHILFDLIECSPTLLDSESHVRDCLLEASEKAKCKVITVQTHKFEPQGVTGFALLEESHMSIHTWPEKNIAKCDIFTCSYDNEPKEAIEYLRQHFHAMEVRRWACDRSL